MANAPLIVVAAALVDGNGRVLVQRRLAGKQHGGLWEFPGGKVEPGEAAEAALVRELAEELGVTVAPADLAPVTFATDPANGRHLVLLLFRVTLWTGLPKALDAEALRWVDHAEAAALAMPPADRPLVAALFAKRN